MDEQNNTPKRPASSRRRKRTQMEIFKEAYLPAIIAGIAVLLVIIFIIGSISRSIQKRKLEQQAIAKESIAAQMELSKLTKESEQLILEADALAEQYDIDGAIEKIQSFKGDINKFPALSDKLKSLEDQKSNMVVWDDPAKVVNLSFHSLIADPSRAFSDPVYGMSYNRNFVTIAEFEKILQDLYDNGYILVSIDDIVETTTLDSGETVYRTKSISLPADKKPLMITQNQANYYTYMTDGDGDKRPDKDGAGFASRLVINSEGKLKCEYINADGKTIIGDYDIVPILDTFIEEHPDFSYQGARAIISVSGYDGLFGYRTHTEAKNTFGQEVYDKEVAEAKKIAEALTDSGYDIACYTYGNDSYADFDATRIRADLSGWTSEVEPILGKLDTFVFAQNGDISTSSAYTGEKYDILHDAGFRYFVGYCTEGTPWATVTNEYVHQGRIMVTGATLSYNASWFQGMFNTTGLLDTTRGTVPNY